MNSNRLVYGSFPIRSVSATILAAMLFAASTMASHAQDVMIMDESNFFMGFEVKFLGLFPIAGRFKEASGTLIYDKNNPAASTVRIIGKTASIDTNFKMRDDHLRSADFFDVKNHPTIVFESTRAGVTVGKIGTVTGNLTIKGITKPVTLHVKAHDRKPYPLPAYKRPLVAGFEASGKVRREDFGLGNGEALLTLRADFIKCVGKAAACTKRR